MKLHLDWSDGRYSTRPLLTDEEVTEAESLGIDVVHLEDHVYETYLRDCERDSIWQAFWRAVSNEQAMRRREKELRPLEEAEREIQQLTADRNQARRMWKHFEQENHNMRGEKHRAEWVEYSCVFPQPGCNVDALPRPEWRERATEILESYSEAHAAEGMKIQGCCCGHTHIKLDDGATKYLREVGFIVEHDVESPPEFES